MIEGKVLLLSVQVQYLITSPPSAIVSDIMNSMFIPGINDGVVEVNQEGEIYYSDGQRESKLK